MNTHVTDENTAPSRSNLSLSPDQNAAASRRSPFATWDSLSNFEKDYWTILLLSVSTLLLFLPVITFPFYHYDDPGYVFDNPHVASGLSWENLKWAFISLNGDISYWHPLTWVSHQVDCQIFGVRSGAHHLTNVIFHIVNTVLLFLFWARATGKRGKSAFVAALFAFHPLHVESVAWVAERKDVLCAFFYFLTLLAYLHYCRLPRCSRYFLTLLLFCCALLSKPTAVTLPCILLLLDFWPLKRLASGPQIGSRAVMFARIRDRVFEKAPFFVLSLAVGIITVIAQKRIGAIIPLAGMPAEIRLDNVIVAYFLYLVKMIWPASLSITYGRSQSWPVWHVVLSGAALFLMALASAQLRRKWPFVLTGFLWFIVVTLPMSGIVQVGAQYMADRYTYLPLVGVATAATWGVPTLFARFTRNYSIPALCAMLTLSGLFYRTSQYLRVWSTEISLFRNAVENTRDNWLAHLLYAGPLVDGARYHEALAQLSEADRLAPRNRYVLKEIANCLFRLGDSKSAVSLLKGLVEIAPEFSDGHIMLAGILATDTDANVRNGSLALLHALTACHLVATPTVSQLDVLASAYAELGQFDVAVNTIRQAIEMGRRLQMDIEPLAKRLKLYLGGNPFHLPPRSGEATAISAVRK